MNWLHNPIADMYGPHFLLLYACVIALTLLAAWGMTRARALFGAAEPPPVPSNPDPYELAYLRGEENEVLLAVILSLLQRGYLRTTEAGGTPLLGGGQQVVEHAPTRPDPRHLSLLEGRVFDWFSTPATVRQAFHADLPEQLKVYTMDYETRLCEQGLLASVDALGRNWVTGLVGAVVILGLGGYKLWVALEKGRHNVGFLILMGLVGLFALIAICGSARRLTARGRAYLHRLQVAFAPVRSRAQTGALPGADMTLPLLFGLFGASVLVGTAYADYQGMLRPASAVSASGCGSSGSGSCGSSCGGSSCGSGGGGGCGGCGS